MFELLITSKGEVQSLVDEGWPTKIISAISDDIPDYGPHHLKLTFHDIDRPAEPYIHPLEEHLMEVLDFTKDLTDDDRLLVHCQAGISRSTAIAIGVCIQHGMSYEDAYNHVAYIRSCLSPNKLIINYIDNHFKLGGKLYDLVEKKDTLRRLKNIAYRSSEQEQVER